MKPLSKLLADYFPDSSLMISSIANDSRKVTSGGIFFACQGELADGRDYIPQAISNGAAVIVYEDSDYCVNTCLTDSVLWLAVSDARDLMATVAARFFDYPADSMKIIGITGTNGKTSVSHFIAQALQMRQINCAVLGTLGNGLLTKLLPSERTTLDAIELQQTLLTLKKQQVTHIAMEVSSHALSQSRVSAIKFDTAVFTQLGRDHLDYHKTMAAYQAAKARLFSSAGLKFAVINADDEFGRSLIKRHRQQLTVISYGLSPCETLSDRFIYASKIEEKASGFNVKVTSHCGSGEFFCPLLGKFNIDNVLAVIGVLLCQGIALTEALNLCHKLQGIAGRMQTFGGDDRVQVIVDYAHTPDALQQVLTSLRPHCRGKLYCVFGCGGDRDQGKRAIMGELANRLADHVVITNDNPRSESPEAIAAAILSGISDKSRVEVVLDRAEAIHRVVQNAATDDMIVIAGKGHETGQLIGAKLLPFSDAEQVINALK